MNELRPLSGFFYIVGTLLVVSAVVWGIVMAGDTQYLVPPPDNVAEQFVKALKRHDFSAARDQLSQDLKSSVSDDQLKQLTQSIEQATGGIDDAQGTQSQQQGGQAEAEVQVKLQQAGQQTLTLPLVRENGLWRVASLDPLSALLSASP